MKFKFIFITVEQVITAHDAIVQRYGGLEGGGHRGSDHEGVEAAVHAVQNSYYDNVYDLAAAYAVYIVQGHVFLDGNKRAASATMLEFLAANRAKTSISAVDLVSLMIELQERARAGENSGDLVRWLASVLKPRRRRRKRGV